MSITKRGGSWQVSVSYQGYRVRKCFQSYDKARQFELDTAADLMAGREPRSDGNKKPKDILRAFGWLADHVWKVEWSKQKSSDHTFNRMMGVINYFGDDTDVSEITSLRVEQYILKLRADGNGGGTINRKLAIVSKIMRYAYKHEFIDRKPEISKQKEPMNKIRYYSQEEEDEMLRLIEDRHLRDLFVLLLDTGLRKNEGLNLTWADVDFDANQIVLNDPATTKSGVSRNIPMTKRISAMLQARLDAARATRVHLGKHVFLAPQQIQNQIRKFKERSGYKGDLDRMLHTCRHTFCSRLIQRGVPLAVVRDLAGHKDIKTTLRYSHLAPSNHYDAITKLERADG